MSEESSRLMWQSPCGNAETVRDGAERFVRETMGAERTPRFGESVGEFWFYDSAWVYRIECNCGHWYVWRTGERSPKAKARAKARREARG